MQLEPDLSQPAPIATSTHIHPPGRLTDILDTHLTRILVIYYHPPLGCSTANEIKLIYISHEAEEAYEAWWGTWNEINYTEVVAPT